MGFAPARITSYIVSDVTTLPLPETENGKSSQHPRGGQSIPGGHVQPSSKDKKLVL